MIARGAKVPVLLSIVPSFILLSLSLLNDIFTYFGLLFLLLPIFTLYFFRDPERKSSEGIVSPADGKVISVDEEKKELVIFMGLSDVHVNRVPCSGVIKETEHMEGKHAPAYSEKASRNEKNKIVLETQHGSVHIYQIAGIFARRIVCYVDEEDKVEKGERLGMIRFGSRVRMELPPSSELTVEEDRKVKASETTVGVWDG